MQLINVNDKSAVAEITENAPFKRFWAYNTPFSWLVVYGGSSFVFDNRHDSSDGQNALDAHKSSFYR